MRGSGVHQVYFPGNHSHLGWIDETEGLVHAPFAWMIQQLHTHLHISFDEARLAARFPGYRRAGPASSSPSAAAPGPGPNPDQAPRWCQGAIPLVGRGILAVMGKKARRPGHLSCSPAAATDLRMHIGARLRAHLDDVRAVPGYVLVVPAAGRLYWARRRRPPQAQWRSWARSFSGSGSDSDNENDGGSMRSGSLVAKGSSWDGGMTASSAGMAERIEEAEVGPLEARLLGLPEEVVGRSGCEATCCVATHLDADGC